jgi:aspartyl-tRNA synthetase
MTEFVGLDLEMAIEEHYHEVLDVLDSLLIAIFSGLKAQYAHEIETIQGQFPCDEFVWLDKTLKLRFSEGIKMLKEAGATGPEGAELGETDDLR